MSKINNIFHKISAKFKDIFYINPYNLDFYKRRLRIYFILLNFFIISYITFTYNNSINSSLNVLLVLLPVMLYLLLWFIRYRVVLKKEELRQTYLSLMRGEKRKYKRFQLDTYESVKVSFSVIAFKFFIELKKTKIAKLIDISKGGIFVKVYDESGIVKGGKAAGIRIVFPNNKNVKAEGVIVRNQDGICAIKFSDISDADKKLIGYFTSNKQLRQNNFDLFE